MRIVLLSVSLMTCIAFTSLEAVSQVNIKVMCYNVLNHPLGDMPGRTDTLEKIIQFYAPDLFMMQELKAELGLNEALNSMNELGTAEFRSSTFVTQQSGGGGSLQHAIIYNNEIFGLAEEDIILTPVRDVNYFKLFLRDEDLEENQDTTFLHVYVTHLKSSSGSSNQELRLQSVEAFLPFLNELNSTDFVIFAGDFNVYNSSEPAYQALLSSDNSPRLYDPINSPGNWGASNYPLKEILTQSTRTSQVFGDGAGGGVDDRFDFILCSDALLNGSSDLFYVDDTYASLGNSGDCYNSTIFGCAGENGLPPGITSALYYQSDHFPVVMELETPLSLSTRENALADVRDLNCRYNKATGILSIENDHAIEGLEIFNNLGQLVFSQGTQLIKGSHQISLQLESGVYFVRDIGDYFPPVRIMSFQ